MNGRPTVTIGTIKPPASDRPRSTASFEPAGRWRLIGSRFGVANTAQCANTNCDDCRSGSTSSGEEGKRNDRSATSAPQQTLYLAMPSKAQEAMQLDTTHFAPATVQPPPVPNLFCPCETAVLFVPERATSLAHSPAREHKHNWRASAAPNQVVATYAHASERPHMVLRRTFHGVFEQSLHLIALRQTLLAVCVCGAGTLC